jgi:hypothetical protein
MHVSKREPYTSKIPSRLERDWEQQATLQYVDDRIKRIPGVVAVCVDAGSNRETCRILVSDWSAFPWPGEDSLATR